MLTRLHAMNRLWVPYGHPVSADGGIKAFFRQFIRELSPFLASLAADETEGDCIMQARNYEAEEALSERDLGLLLLLREGRQCSELPGE